MNEGPTVLSEQEMNALSEAAAKANVKISAKVYRAATDTWEDLGLISESEQDITEAQTQEFLKDTNEPKPQ